MAKRGRPKKLDSDPCPRGHVAGRGKNGHCKICAKLSERARRKRGGKKPKWLVTAGAAWIAAAVKCMKKRKSPGQAHANPRQLFALWLSQNGKCALTGLPVVGTPQLDHVVPVSKGGGHTVDNLQWTDEMANQGKGSRTVEEFRAWLLAAAEALKQKMQLEELL